MMNDAGPGLGSSREMPDARRQTPDGTACRYQSVKVGLESAAVPQKNPKQAYACMDGRKLCSNRHATPYIVLLILLLPASSLIISPRTVSCYARVDVQASIR